MSNNERQDAESMVARVVDESATSALVVVRTESGKETCYRVPTQASVRALFARSRRPASGGG